MTAQRPRASLSVMIARNVARPLAIALCLSLAWPTLATPPPPPVDHAVERRLAGGYRALTTCSALFTATRAGAQRSLSSVEANELAGVYPELAPYVRDGEVTVGSNHVLVRWDPSQPPSVAWWRAPDGGCSLLPYGTAVADALDRRRAGPRPLAPDTRAWPQGDAGAFEPLTIRDDGSFIDATMRMAFDGTFGEGSNTTAVVVVRNGHIVREHYAPGFGADVPQRTWSVAKSIAATIIGAAVQRGDVDVNAPAAIAPWRAAGDPRGAITIDHLLHMASGLTSDTAGNRTDGIYFGGVAVDTEATGWPLAHEPGSTYRYANNDTLLAVLAIRPSFAAHPPRELFDRLGMRATIAEQDPAGNYVLSSQVWATARDLARFGMLYLDDGMWNGQRVLPQGWRTYVSTPSGPQPPGDFGYGASFWLMNRSEGVPADTIAAFGNRGQYVVIVPSRNIVIVRRGEDPAGTRFDIAAFAADILSGLSTDEAPTP